MVARNALLVMGIVATAVEGSQTSTFLTQHSDKWTVAEYASQALEAMLKKTELNKCFPFFLTDSITSVLSLVNRNKYMGDNGEWLGVGVFGVSVGGHDANLTRQQLSLVVSQASQVSLCVTVVVVSDDPVFLAAFAHWSLKCRLLAWSTRLLLLTRLPRDDLRALLSSHWTFSMMNTMAINIDMSAQTTVCGIFAHLPYTPTGARVVQVASWTPSGGFIHLKSRSMFPDKFRNFHGMRMNATALPFEPYWITSGEGDNTTHFGMDYSQLMYLARALNFTVHILSSRNWDEVTDQVEARQSFVASIIYHVLPIYFEVWDFTYAVEQGALGFAMAKPVLKPSWLSFYYPLGNQVWAGVFISTLAICFTLVWITRTQVWWSKHGRLSSGSVVVEMVGSFLGQGLFDGHSSSRSNYILVGSWLMFGLVVGTAYRGSLIASLNIPRLPPAPQTAEELIKAVERITCEPYGLVYKDTFLHSTSEILEELGRLIYLGVSTAEGLRDSFVIRQAHINTVTYLKFIIAQNLTNADGSRSVYIGRERILPTANAWPLPHDAPYKHLFDKHILAVWEAGLYVQWEKETLAQVAQESKTTQRNQQWLQEQEHLSDGPDKVAGSGRRVSLTIMHLQGPLALLVLGFIIAGLAFGMEKCVMLSTRFP